MQSNTTMVDKIDNRLFKTSNKQYWWNEDALWETLPEVDWDRGKYLHSTIGLRSGTPMEELEEGLKELKGIATL